MKTSRIFKLPWNSLTMLPFQSQFRWIWRCTGAWTACSTTPPPVGQLYSLDTLYFYQINWILDIYYSYTGGFVNSFTKLNMAQGAHEPSAVQYAILRHHSSKSQQTIGRSITVNVNVIFSDLFHCKKRFENTKMNPLASLCTDRTCYSTGGCRPFIRLYQGYQLIYTSEV